MTLSYIFQLEKLLQKLLVCLPNKNPTNQFDCCPSIQFQLLQQKFGANLTSIVKEKTDFDLFYKESYSKLKNAIDLFENKNCV